MRGDSLRWFDHVLCRPTNASVHNCESMASEGVKRDEVDLKSYLNEGSKDLGINADLAK